MRNLATVLVILLILGGIGGCSVLVARGVTPIIVSMLDSQGGQEQVEIVYTDADHQVMDSQIHLYKVLMKYDLTPFLYTDGHVELSAASLLEDFQREEISMLGIVTWGETPGQREPGLKKFESNHGLYILDLIAQSSVRDKQYRYNSVGFTFLVEDLMFLESRFVSDLIHTLQPERDIYEIWKIAHDFNQRQEYRHTDSLITMEDYDNGVYEYIYFGPVKTELDETQIPEVEDFFEFRYTLVVYQ